MLFSGGLRRGLYGSAQQPILFGGLQDEIYQATYAKFDITGDPTLPPTIR